MAETLRGRTKDSHPGIKAQAEKIRGRTKFNNQSIKSQSTKMRKISIELEKQIYEMRCSGMLVREIQDILNIPYQSISTAFNRYKREMHNYEG